MDRRLVVALFAGKSGAGLLPDAHFGWAKDDAGGADFQTSEGLTIPRTYRLVLTYDSPNRPFITQWDYAVTCVRHNQDLEPAVFAIR